MENKDLISFEEHQVDKPCQLGYMNMEAIVEVDNERPPYSLPPHISQPYPWLVISHGEFDQRQTFFSISQYQYYTKIIPEMRNKQVCCSSFGWLVLLDLVSFDCSLLNLISMETIQLPPFNMKFDTCILTALPSDPNCRILFFNLIEDEFLFCSLDDCEFSKQKLEDDDVISVTTFGGKTYCISSEYCLLTIEFEGSSLRFTKLTVQKTESKLFNFTIQRKNYLVEFFGEMLLVCKIYSPRLCEWASYFEVFRFDFYKREWIEVKSIGNNAIFLTDQCYGSCSSVVEESDIRRNSIYYTQYEDRNLYVYDLEDRSVTTSLPCPIVSRRKSSHYWIMDHLLK
ncbi:uncharacterized protein LOC111276861 [Durio zibethinus]|uniref:Uncharacterized protein LOC111276861 n=1 Tax=Durio zibethinus TaxID=66656 RepID=A0A6P5WRM5_DURZI|nr:uncharacterized protein LOC111276861 [Durio zibethinus]